MTMKAVVMVVIIMKTYAVFSMSYGLVNTDYLILKQLYHHGPCFTDEKQRTEKLNSSTSIAQLMMTKARTGIKEVSLQIPGILTRRFTLGCQIDSTFIKLREVEIYRTHF